MPLQDDALKACCSALYQSDWARLLLGESFHPGGLRLTERAGAVLELHPGSHLADVASGVGASAVHLAQVFGCSAVGVDYGPQNVHNAAERAAQAGLGDRVRFMTGDAEAIPLDTAGYDAVLCECALCTFPSKPKAVREFYRLLRPGGRVVVSDVVCGGPLAPELETLLAWVACIADARPSQEYVSLLEAGGLRVLMVEPHAEALREIVQQVQTRLMAADLMVKLGKATLPEGISIPEAHRLAKAALAAVQNGTLGYALFLAEKP